jgi:hypothetical protein
MTSMQIYGLVTPILVLALGGLFAWWNHHTIMKHRHHAKSGHARPAE